MQVMTGHPVWRLSGQPQLWLAQGPPTRSSRATYGLRGGGYNPREIGSFSTWWADPCNKTLIVAAVLSAAASAIVTQQMRKKKKTGERA